MVETADDKDVETLPLGGSDVGGGSSVAGANSPGGTLPSAGSGSTSGTAGAPLGGSGGSASGGTASGGSDPGGEVGGGGMGGGAPIPTGPIDFRRWVLQLPTGSGTSPDTISSAELLGGFENAYFYPTEEEGGRAFMDPKQGITTSGSTRCRSEMREQNIDGGNAAWPSSGSHTLDVEGAVTKMGSGSIAVAQLFNGTDSIPLGELQYTTGHKFSLWYQEAKGAGSGTDLKTSVTLGTKYKFQLAMTDGTFTIKINDKQVYSHKPSGGILDNKFYFKVGNYDQSTSKGTPNTTPYSIAEVYKIDIVHQ